MLHYLHTKNRTYHLYYWTHIFLPCYQVSAFWNFYHYAWYQKWEISWGYCCLVISFLHFGLSFCVISEMEISWGRCYTVLKLQDALADFSWASHIQFQVIILHLWMLVEEGLIWINDLSFWRAVLSLLLQLNIWSALQCLHCISSSSTYQYLLLKAECWR